MVDHLLLVLVTYFNTRQYETIRDTRMSRAVGAKMAVNLKVLLEK